MIPEYNVKSLALGVPGLLLQIAANLLDGSPHGYQPPLEHALAIIVSLMGTGLLLIGLAYYAKAKGRHPAWCLMAFLSLIGVIVLACLEDRSGIDHKVLRFQQRLRREMEGDWRARP